MTLLSRESQAILDEVFHLRYSVRWKEKANHFTTAAKKFLVPIGLQRLKVQNVEYKKAKNGADMLVIDLWKQPDVLNHMKEKPTYKAITNYHIVQDNSNKKLSEGWFKPFTSCYTKTQLDQLLKFKGKWFIAMVQHVEDKYNDNNFFRAEIIKVYKDGYETNLEDINYFNLFKTLKK